MTSELDTTKASVGDRARARTFHREFWPAMIAYGVLLAAAITWGDLDGPAPSRFVWALLPVLPIAWTAFTIIRHLRRVDDYQRLLLLQGLATGFVVAMLVSVTVGFLGVAGLELVGAGWIIYGAGMFGWLVAGSIASTR
jgi:hypothetical protein